MLRDFKALRELVGSGEPKTVAVACAHDAHTLEAVLHAASEGILKYILVGHREDILRIGEIIRDRLLPEPRLQESPAGEDPSAAESPDPGPGASGIPGDESRPTQFRSPPQSCQ